jgi:hypothetical protein
VSGGSKYTQIYIDIPVNRQLVLDGDAFFRRRQKVVNLKDDKDEKIFENQNQT